MFSWAQFQYISIMFETCQISSRFLVVKASLDRNAASLEILPQWFLTNCAYLLNCIQCVLRLLHQLIWLLVQAVNPTGSYYFASVECMHWIYQCYWVPCQVCQCYCMQTTDPYWICSCCNQCLALIYRQLTLIGSVLAAINDWFWYTDNWPILDLFLL